MVKVGDFVRYEFGKRIVMGIVVEKIVQGPKLPLSMRAAFPKYFYTIDILDSSGTKTSWDVYDCDIESGNLEVLQPS